MVSVAVRHGGCDCYRRHGKGGGELSPRLRDAGQKTLQSTCFQSIFKAPEPLRKPPKTTNLHIIQVLTLLEELK